MKPDFDIDSGTRSSGDRFLLAMVRIASLNVAITEAPSMMVGSVLRM